MSAPNAVYSVRMRVQLVNEAGAFARLATAIGNEGGVLGPLEIIDVSHSLMVRDVTVMASDADHVSRIRSAVDELEGITVLEVVDRVLQMHRGGKIEVHSRLPVITRDELSMAYTPGVARVCREIAERPEEVRHYTIKANTVAIVSDGTAVLGLGNIGPHASLPVMEGKALLFKEFADIDGFPICLTIDPPNEDGTDPGVDQIVDIVTRMEPVFGGVNLEDIASPRCFEVERRLRENLDIPVFHDDQHGTAVVVLAALRNALKVVGKTMHDVKVVQAGAGAAGVAIAKILNSAGVGEHILCDISGVIHEDRVEPILTDSWVVENTNPNGVTGTLRDAIVGADVFIGVSAPNLLQADDLRTMAKDPIIFAMANPDPEVLPSEALGVAAVYATGRSDYPNQINNVLAYPGIFRGALDVGATDITENMKLVASEAIAAEVPVSELSPDYIIPSVFNKNVVTRVRMAVAEAAIADGVAREEH